MGALLLCAHCRGGRGAACVARQEAFGGPEGGQEAAVNHKQTKLNTRAGMKYITPTNAKLCTPCINKTHNWMRLVEYHVVPAPNVALVGREISNANARVLGSEKEGHGEKRQDAPEKPTDGHPYRLSWPSRRIHPALVRQ